MLDNNISKESDFNHRRKVAWLRSDHQFHLSEGVSASLPYYFMEGEVQHNLRKIIDRMKELGYDTLLFGDRDEPQTKCVGGAPLVFEGFLKEFVDVILKVRFQNTILEMLQSRKYLISPSHREVLIELIRNTPLPNVKGIYWVATPIPRSLLHHPDFRRWTISELLLEEVRLMEQAFEQIPLLFIESSQELSQKENIRTVSAVSCYAGHPWEEFRSPNPLLQKKEPGYSPLLILHNKGLLRMGEGLWPIQRDSAQMTFPKNNWGDCDLYNQFPSDNRLSKNWGPLGAEARLLWLKMSQGKEKITHRVQWDSWNHQLKEFELRAEENPLIRHFIADAWCFLYSLQSQPIPQGVGQGGFWKGRPLEQEPLGDGSPWFNSSRLI